eukprot:454626-Hanusia_phi.AAC.1
MMHVAGTPFLREQRGGSGRKGGGEGGGQMKWERRAKISQCRGTGKERWRAEEENGGARQHRLRLDIHLADDRKLTKRGAIQLREKY